MQYVFDDEEGVVLLTRSRNSAINEQIKSKTASLRINKLLQDNLNNNGSNSAYGGGGGTSRGNGSHFGYDNNNTEGNSSNASIYSKSLNSSRQEDLPVVPLSASVSPKTSNTESFTSTNTTTTTTTTVSSIATDSQQQQQQGITGRNLAATVDNRRTVAKTITTTTIN